MTAKMLPGSITGCSLISAPLIHSRTESDFVLALRGHRVWLPVRVLADHEV